jgi:chromosomal replication initiator protein
MMRLHDPIPLRTIVNRTAAVFGLSTGEIRSRRRSRTLVRARWAAILMMRRHTLASAPEMARAIGGKDHTSVLNALRTVTQAVDLEPAFHDRLQQLDDDLLALSNTNQGEANGQA